MIETDRLILRPWQDSDAEALFRYASDPDVGPRAGWPPHKDIEESKRVIRDIFTNDRTWAVTLRETGEAIGCMGYYIHGESNIPIGEEDAEIGYWIVIPYWNRGIATEALRAWKCRRSGRIGSLTCLPKPEEPEKRKPERPNKSIYSN